MRVCGTFGVERSLGVVFLGLFFLPGCIHSYGASATGISSFDGGTVALAGATLLDADDLTNGTYSNLSARAVRVAG